MKSEGLFLHEEAMLLALREEEGTVEMGAWYNTAVGGAVLAELLLAERIRVVREGKKEHVKVASSQGLGEELIDEVLRTIAGETKPQSLQHWVGHVANKKDLKHRVARGLCRRGILRTDEDKVGIFFSRKIYPEVNPEPERRIIERLRRAIFTDASDLDTRTVVLLSLADRTGLLQANFDKKELKKRKERIEAVVNGDMTGQATAAVVQATQMSVIMIALCVTPIIIS